MTKEEKLENEEIKETEGTEETNEEEEVKEEFKSFIQEETREASEKALNEFLDVKAEELVSKFMQGIEKQRKVATSNKPKAVSEEVEVKTWFRALMDKDVKTLRTLEKGYMNEGTEASGGYLVPPALLAEVNRFVQEAGVCRRDMRYLPFSGAGNSRKIPTLLSSVATYWVGEGGKKPSTKPTFAVVTQVLKKIAAICPMTEELIEDSAINIISLLGELFGEAVAVEEDRVFLTGKDANAGGTDPFTGVLHTTGVVPVAIGSSDPTEKKFGNELVDAMNKALYSVPAEIRRQGKFYIHSDFFGVIQRVKDDNKNYIVQQPQGDRPATIWNKPVELVDVLPDITASGEGTPIGFFSYLGKTCAYGDKAGLRVKYLTEATIGEVEGEDGSPASINLAEQDMVALRIVKRTGYVPILPQGIAVLQLGDES